MLPRGARRSFYTEGRSIAERGDCVTMLSDEFSTEHFCSLDDRFNLCFIVEQRVGRVVKWIIGMSYFCETAQSRSFGDSDIFLCGDITVQHNEVAVI